MCGCRGGIPAPSEFGANCSVGDRSTRLGRYEDSINPATCIVRGGSLSSFFWYCPCLTA